MLCSRCDAEYVWSATVIAGHPGDETERGWIRKAALAEEKRYPEEVTSRLRARVGPRWRQRLEAARSRKAKWEILTVRGQGYPSLGTFYQHTKGMGPGELERYLEAFVSFHHLGRFRDAFGIKPADVGVGEDSRCPVCGGTLVGNVRGLAMCSACKFIRPKPGF